MNKIQQLTLGTAQAMAEQAAEATKANQNGVMILVAPRQSDLFFHITSVANDVMEVTMLLCSATSLERLTAHAKVFVENLKP